MRALLCAANSHGARSITGVAETAPRRGGAHSPLAWVVPDGGRVLPRSAACTANRPAAVAPTPDELAHTRCHHSSCSHVVLWSMQQHTAQRTGGSVALFCWVATGDSSQVFSQLSDSSKSDVASARRLMARMRSGAHQVRDEELAASVSDR